MKLKKTILVVVLIPIMITIYGLLTSTSNKPADPPNWANEVIDYKIIKEKGNYLVWYQSENATGKYFVGDSKLGLDNYLNKSVRIIGDFPKTYSDNETAMQCIKNECHAIFKKFVFFGSRVLAPTINISMIELNE